MTSPTDSLGLAKFACEVFAKNKSLADKLLKLQETVTDEQIVRKVNEESLAQVKGSVAASEELNAKLTESDKLLEALHAELVSLKKQVFRARGEKKESNEAI